MNRVIAREERQTSHESVIERIKIGVMGTGIGAGCTFAATALAFLLAGGEKRSVGFIQLDGKYGHDIYDSLGMDKRFAGRKFEDFFAIAGEMGQIRGVKNIDECINWALVKPGSEVRRPPIGELLRLAGNMSCDLLVCDLGGGICANEEERSARRELAAAMDALVCVVDPMPSKLLADSITLPLAKEYELKRGGVVWALNKYNDGVNQRELRAFLRIKNAEIIPCIPAEHFYRAEYNCRIPMAERRIAEAAAPPFSRIIARLHDIITDL